MLGTDTLPALLRDAAERFGDHLAYIEGPRTVSYAELLRLVERTSTVYNLAPGDRVVIWGPNSIDWAVAALAVSYAGGVLVPVNSRYVGAEVADVVERTGAKSVVVHDGFLGRDQVRELRDAGVDPGVVITMTDLMAAEPRAAEPATVTPDDVADILFTSGTTGRSKGAMS